MDFEPLCEPITPLRKAVRILSWMTRSLDDTCARSGLTLARYRTLLLLKPGPLRATELACVLRVSAPTLSGLARGLEAPGLIRRASSRGDRRGVRLELTAAGHEALLRAEQLLEEELASVGQRFLGPISSEPMLQAACAAYDAVLARWAMAGPLAALGPEGSFGAGDLAFRAEHRDL